MKTKTQINSHINYIRFKIRELKKIKKFNELNGFDAKAYYYHNKIIELEKQIELLQWVKEINKD